MGEGEAGRVLEFWPPLFAFAVGGRRGGTEAAESRDEAGEGDPAAGPSARVPLAEPANRRVVGASLAAEAGIRRG